MVVEYIGKKCKKKREIENMRCDAIAFTQNLSNFVRSLDISERKAGSLNPRDQLNTNEVILVKIRQTCQIDFIFFLCTQNTLTLFFFFSSM